MVFFTDDFPGTDFMRLGPSDRLVYSSSWRRGDDGMIECGVLGSGVGCQGRVAEFAGQVAGLGQERGGDLVGGERGGGGGASGPGWPARGASRPRKARRPAGYAPSVRSSRRTRMQASGCASSNSMSGVVAAVQQAVRAAGV